MEHFRLGGNVGFFCT